MMNLIDLLAMAPTTAQGGAAAQQTGAPPLVFFIVLLALMYFVMIRPHNKRQKEHQAMIQAVKTGDKVVFSGGILGTVANVKDNTVMVKVDDGVKLEIQKASIVSIENEKEKSEKK